MVPNKLVYSGNFFLKHERVYTRLLGRLSVALRLTFLKFSLVIGIPVVILNDLGFIIVRLSNVSIVDSNKYIFNFFLTLKLVKTLYGVKMRPFMTEAHSQLELIDWCNKLNYGKVVHWKIIECFVTRISYIINRFCWTHPIWHYKEAGSAEATKTVAETYHHDQSK